jgi:hypothetical protein
MIKNKNTKVLMKNTYLLILGIGLLASSITFAAGSTAQAPAINLQSNILFEHPDLPMTATSLFAPIGYGPNWGAVFGSLAGVNRWPGGHLSDGSLSVGMGLGNSDKYVGGSLSLLVDSLGLRNQAFAKNSALSGAIYRWITPSTSIAVGASKIAGVGVFKNTANGFFAAGTQLIALTPNASFHTPFVVSVGVGSGPFVSAQEMMVFKRDARLNAFGALSISPIQQLSLIADYAEQLLSLGASIVPIRTLPVVVTAYASNVAGGHKVPGPVTYGLRIGVGYAFS